MMVAVYGYRFFLSSRMVVTEDRVPYSSTVILCLVVLPAQSSAEM